MGKLSLAMIVRNEAATLGHCLKSIASLVDEIIVVDTGSTDGTPELAVGAGARVFSFPWRDDFAAARNESLRHCTGEWVLILDADEAIDALDHGIIRDACQREDRHAYRLVLRNYVPSGAFATVGEAATLNQSPYAEGRDCSHYADHRGTRLCRRAEGLAFTGRIHELLDPLLESRGLPVYDLDAVIHHYGKFLQEREAFKRGYYLELTRQEACARKDDPQAQFNLIQQAHAARDWDQALAAVKAYLSLKRDVPAYVLLVGGLALQQLDRHADALALFDQLLAALPEHATALTQTGVSLAVLGQPEKAKALWRKAMSLAPGFVTPCLNFAELAGTTGDWETARKVLEEGLAQIPDDADLHEARVKLGLQAQDMARAMADATMALRACPRGGRGLWHRLAALGLLQRGQKTEAAALLRQGLSIFPDDSELTGLLQRI